MAKDVLNKLSVTELEKSLGKTIYSKFRKAMDSYIMEALKTKDGNNFSIPIIQAIANEKNSLGKKLIELYDSKLALEDTSRVSNEMKILQASALDGLVVGVNMAKGGEIAIYTANVNAIFGMDVETRFSLDKTLELNEQGIVHAVRVDITYTSESGFEFKPVNLNKNTCLDVIDLDTGKGKFFLVPYLAIQRSMLFFKEQLDNGRTLEVVQEIGDMKKVRYISARGVDLAKYCDSKEFAMSLKPEYFPLKGFFYAPVLGASSMTAGRTRIDLINIARVDLPDKIKVEKPVDALNDMILESVVQKFLVQMDEASYSNLVSRLPKIYEMFGDYQEVPSPVMIMKYYHQLRGKDKENFYKVILSEDPNFMEDVAKHKSLINKCELLNVDDYSQEEIKKMLSSGVYKFIIRKKDCEYSSMTVTNNEEYLKLMYGNDYFGKYESLGVRLYKLENMVEKDDTLDGIREALVYCGFDCFELPEGVESTVEHEVFKIMSTDDIEKSKHERLAELLKGAETKGKGIRRTSDAEKILVRKCFATLNSTGSVEYYKYLDVKNVTSMFRVG